MGNDENKKVDNKLIVRCTNVIAVTFSTCVSLLIIGICVWLMRLMLG